MYRRLLFSIHDSREHTPIPSIQTISPVRFETPALLKKLASASRKLAQLEGEADSIPQQAILVNTLSIQDGQGQFGD